MPLQRQIKEADNLVLVKIILDYLRGHSTEEITLRLKEQCIKFDIACKTRYQTVEKSTHTPAVYDDYVDQILDALSIGGAPLHLMDPILAKEKGLINCYVWHDATQTLTYLHPSQPDVMIELKNKNHLINMIEKLKAGKPVNTIHLYAKWIKQYITDNSLHPIQHVSFTTQLNQIQDYKNSYNLYDLLKKLESYHPRLTALIDQINQTKPAHRWWLYFLLASGVTGFAGLAIYLKENIVQVKDWYEKIYPIIMRWLSNTFNIIKNTPLIGILSHGFPLLYSWYKAIIYNSFAHPNKIVKLCFKTLEHLLPIVGYVLCFLAAGVMTIPAVSLFIAGSVIDLIETVYTIMNGVVDHYLNPLAPATDYYSASMKACADNTYERDLSICFVKLVANLLAIASIVVWCVFPPSLLIAMTCVVFSFLVNLTKQSLITYLKNSYANALQTEIKEIADHYETPVDGSATLSRLEVEHQITTLKQNETHLIAENTLLKQLVSSPTFFQKKPSSIPTSSMPLDEPMRTRSMTI